MAATSLVDAVHLKVQAEPTTPCEIVIGQGHLLVRRHGQRGTDKKHDTKPKEYTLKKIMMKKRNWVLK